MEVNERIKKRRIELELSLKDVAKALGVAESTVSRYESKDIQNMGIDKIEALSKVLQCTPAYLMGWEENKTTNTEVDEKQKQIDTVAAHLEDKDLTPKKLKLLQNYIDALFDEDEE